MKADMSLRPGSRLASWERPAGLNERCAGIWKGVGEMWVKVCLPIVLSTLEILSMFALMLAVFRFKFLRYGRPLLLLSIPMSVASFFIRSAPVLEPFKPLLMYVLFFLAIKMLFGLRYTQVLMVTLIGYIGYGLLQTLMAWGGVASGLTTMADIMAMGPVNYVLQAVSIVITSGIVALIVRFRWGFSFISQHVRFTMSSSHIWITLIVMGSGVITFFSLRTVNLIMVVALAADFYLLMQLARTKELQEA
ncbi:hypothetical protein [Paenibacillus silviterrae]|uniref:hypothetical protein n=1 Tax=Paenibacillus silviterrae TaxID=3242194 RepID=UPI002543499F|nr:hypothetical protein [Paenibacillus chinjuensis]